MHDYEALHYDKEQLKEACERHAGLGGWGRESTESPEGQGSGTWPVLTACSALQPCRWAPWWSRETATLSSAAPTSRGCSR